mmetsp:Transcript_19174/g.30554  ORF Transcript_19174/g.30554 Transcript_19174/m.30554 type:complete len:213 (-) Transcript_19174:1586-2224(-)
MRLCIAPTCMTLERLLSFLYDKFASMPDTFMSSESRIGLSLSTGAKAAISDFDGSDTMTALPNFNEFASLATIFITAPPAQYRVTASFGGRNNQSKIVVSSPSSASRVCTDGSWAKSASRIANRCRIAAFSSLPAPANFVSTCRSMTSLLLIRKRFFGEFHRRAISALRTCSRTLLSLFGGSWRAHTSMRYFSAFSAPKSSWLRSSLSVSQR